MSALRRNDRVPARYLERRAVVYVRQSSGQQVRDHKESQRLQYALVERAQELGWRQVEVVDRDLGSSATLGAAPRNGFDQVIAAVARGEVGAVFNWAVSRLARTDRDWVRLLEVCQVFDTLVADEERLYDPSCPDDQLVLGIKGTMTVVQYNILKRQMLAARRKKAERGDLYSILPVGYVLDADSSVVKDPDQRVQHAVATIFARFREIWSIRQCLKWFHDEQFELPVNHRQAGQARLIWKLPSYSFLSGVLHNPFYGGAYTHGRRQTEMVLVDGRVRRRQGRTRAPEECRVFLPDHHEGYIDWETYEDNQRIIRRNCLRTVRGDSAVTAVRKGKGLLAGMLRCGRCGRRLHVRYWGKSGTAARYLCKGDFDSGGSYCLGFGGAMVDRRFSEELLHVLSPLGMKASVAALERYGIDHGVRQQALSNQLEQAEYEVLRAFEQYDEADPRNRLVAAELERRWEAKLEQVDQLKARLAAVEEAPSLGEDERRAIEALGQRFADVWASEHCPIELKKKIVRTAVEEIVVDLDEDTKKLSFVTHWAGGTHTQFEMDKVSAGQERKTAIEDLEVMRLMGARYGDGDIARVLNKLGRRTGTGRRWNQNRVAAARRSYSIPGRSKTPVDPELLTLARAAKYAGVSNTTITKLVRHGLLPMNQLVPFAPWEIRRNDIDSEPVRGIIARLLETGHLVLEGDVSVSQLTMFD